MDCRRDTAPLSPNATRPIPCLGCFFLFIGGGFDDHSPFKLGPGVVAQARQTGFKLKALLYPFHNQSLKLGAFKPGSSLHRPTSKQNFVSVSSSSPRAREPTSLTGTAAKLFIVRQKLIVYRPLQKERTAGNESQRELDELRGV